MRWEQLYEDSAERKLNQEQKQLEMTHKLQQEEGTQCTFKPTISFNSRWLAAHLNDLPDDTQANGHSFCNTTLMNNNKLNFENDNNQAKQVSATQPQSPDPTPSKAKSSTPK